MCCETTECFHHPSTSQCKTVRRSRRPGSREEDLDGVVFLGDVAGKGGHTHGIPKSTEEEGNLEQSRRVGKAGVRSNCLPISAGLKVEEG